MPQPLSGYRQVVTDCSGGAAQLVKRWARGYSNWKVVIRWLASDVVVRCCVRKTPNATLGLSSLPVVVAQADKILQIGSFCVGVRRQTQNMMHHMREEDMFWPKVGGVCPTIKLASCGGEENNIVESYDNCNFNTKRKNSTYDRQYNTLPKPTRLYWW